MFLLPIDSMATVPSRSGSSRAGSRCRRRSKAIVFLGGAIRDRAGEQARSTSSSGCTSRTSVLNAAIVVVVAMRLGRAVVGAAHLSVEGRAVGGGAARPREPVHPALRAHGPRHCWRRSRAPRRSASTAPATSSSRPLCCCRRCSPGTSLPVFASSFKAGREVFNWRYGRAVHMITVVALPVAVGGAMIGWRVLPALPGFDKFHPGAASRCRSWRRPPAWRSSRSSSRAR